MKIRVEENEKNETLEVVIHCQKINHEVHEIQKALLYFDKTIIGKKDDRSYTLTPNDIFYFDSVDNKVFAYTKDDLFDVNLKLYQLETLLINANFLRINKNTIVNTNKIKSFKSTLNGRMEAKLISDERLDISRMYVPKLKEMLGGKNR
ncbi:MAG: LytTR family transcriptional regulator [Acholeplasmataceae bacterium]|nr:LytTR family transcriptional regulator [Acholeplasmataceae bacterium]